MDFLNSSNANMAPHYLIMAFFAITFLQSGIDKVIDWKGNLGWLNGHFKSSALAGQVKLMLGILTIVEFISGLACIWAMVALLKDDKSAVSCALTICGVNLLMLLFGQRMAKDYAGAATIGQYMVMVLLGFALL
ncbi:MAG: hypothetical protein KDD33_11675 [Bdellovibrionales bacterium]|nr:hypothetical protein [Bdellovibrionales bacterium]